MNTSTANRNNIDWDYPTDYESGNFVVLSRGVRIQMPDDMYRVEQTIQDGMSYQIDLSGDVSVRVSEGTVTVDVNSTYEKPSLVVADEDWSAKDGSFILIDSGFFTVYRKTRSVDYVFMVDRHAVKLKTVKKGSVTITALPETYYQS